MGRRELLRGKHQSEARRRMVRQNHCATCGAILNHLGEELSGECFDCQEKRIKNMSEQDKQAWDEDEADMQRIKDEWDAYDRDPPGS